MYVTGGIAGRGIDIMKKLYTLIIVAVAAIATSTAVVLAGWCWSDPIVGFTAPGMKEADVSIDVAVPEENVKDVVDVLIVVRHPANVIPRVKFMDGILSERVVFVPTWQMWSPGNRIPIEVTVTVNPSDTAVAGGPNGPIAGLIAMDDLPFDVAYTVTHTLANGTKATLWATTVEGRPASISFMLHVHP